MSGKRTAHFKVAQAARAMRGMTGVLLLGFVTGCGPGAATEPVATTRLALDCSSGGSAPGEWTSVDIGSPTTGATCYYQDGSFVVEGYGEGVARPGETPDTDQMRFVYRDAPGDIEITFRLTALSGPAGDGATRAGVAIRAGTAADAEMGSGIVGLGAYESADPDADEQAVSWRSAEGIVHGSGGVPGPSLADGPVWFRLQRVGNDFAVARRADDSPFWVPVSLPGGGAFTASSSVKVGFFVSGGTASTAATGTFDHVYVGPPRTTHRNTWVGSSFDQASTGWVAQSLNTLYVPPDGSRVFRYYDLVEEGAVVQAYDGATGAIEAIPGYIAGGVQQGVMAGDGTSIYVAKPTGSGSFCVERRDSDLLLEAGCASGVALGPVGGMAVGPDGSNTLVYVSQPSNGTIVALDAQTLAVDRSFSVNARPGPLAVDHGGYLWVAHTATTYPNVGSYDVLYTASLRSYEPDGTYTGREIDDVVNPTALAVDPSANRLLVAENGPNQNIRIYEDLGTTPVLETTFGEPGGIFSTTRGRVFDASHGGAARFYSLSGVSIDDSGNIYVAAGGRGGAGLDIRKFNASGNLQWSTYGLLNFLNMVDFDPATDGEDLYGSRHHLTFDPEQTAPGSEWGFSALTWNPFPTSGDVERDEHGRVGRRSGGPRLINLGSQRFMFLPASERDDDPNPNTPSDPASYADNNRIVTNIYRFEGETAVMCGSITTELVCGFGTIGPADGPGTPYYECARMSAEECPCNVDDDADEEVLTNFSVMRLWVDTDGDGVKDANEVQSTVDPFVSGNVPEGNWPASPPTSAMTNNPPPGIGYGFDVDSQGDLWLSFGSGVGLWRLKRDGMTGNGLVPNYHLLPAGTGSSAFRVLDTAPSSFQGTHLKFDRAADKMYFFSGTHIARYDQFLAGTRTQAYSVALPTTQRDLFGDLTSADARFMAFDVAGDAIFAMHRFGQVYVFRESDGSAFTSLPAGPGISGFHSWSAGVRAFKRSTGEYLLAAPDDSGHARTIITRWTPACDPNAPFDPPLPAFTGSTNADGLTFSNDGLTAYVSGKASTNYDIYVATRSDPSAPFGSLSALTSVNTSADERAPFLSEDGLRLYFTRASPYGDIYVATRSSQSSSFGTPQSITSINSSVSDQDPFFLWENQTLYFSSERPSGAQRELYATTLSGGSYSTPALLDVVNSSSAEDYHPVLSSDGTTLYFASTRSGLGGDTNGDIFVAQRASIGDDFGSPANLAGLNSSGIDFPVAASSDGCTLYFGSNRATGLGGAQSFRLFQATRGRSTPAQVTVHLDIVGTGSVTTSPFNCSTGNAGTCSANGSPGATQVLWASSSALWTGSCTGNNGNPSSDGVLVYTNGGTCTVTF